MSAGIANRKLLIAHCGKLTRSETFIQAHLRYLPGVSAFAEGAPPVVLRPEEALPGDGVVFSGDDDFTKDCTEVLEKVSPDIVLAEYGPTGVMWCDACAAKGIPLVTFFHGFDASLHKVLERFGDGYRKLLREGAGVIAPSKALLDRLTPYTSSSTETFVNPYGVDIEQFAYRRPEASSQVKEILFVGRFVEKKAPDLALKAVIPFLQADSSRTFVMIGNGPLRDECARIADQFRVASQVSFPTDTSHSHVRAAMQRADLFVLPSRIANSGDCEGLPVVLLEAAASGLPLLSTYHSGIPEFIRDGETGLLVQENDTDSLAQCLSRFCVDGALRNSCSRNARKLVEERYSLNHHVERLVAALSAIAKKFS